MWRVLTGRHRKATLSFMLAGHTKFAPDWGFGLLKQKFRKTKVNSLAELAATVETSAVHNFAQLVGTEDGTSIVPMYDWTRFLKPHFKRLQGILSYRHFTVTAADPGVVEVKRTAESVGKKLKLIKGNWTPDKDDLPPVIPPPGLSIDRQWYLYDNIREFCSRDTQDITCPLPAVPRTDTSEEFTSPPQSPQSTQSSLLSSPPPSPPSRRPPPAKKRQFHCSICGEAGHTRRTHQQKSSS